MNPCSKNKSVNWLNKRKSSLELCGSEKVNRDLEAQALLPLLKLYNSSKSKRKRSKKEQSALASWLKRWTSKDSKNDKRDLASKRKRASKLNDSSVRRDLVKWTKLHRQAWRQSNSKKKEKLEWKDSESLKSRSLSRPCRRRVASTPIAGSRKCIGRISKKEVGREASDGISQEANNSKSSRSDAVYLSLL